MTDCADDSPLLIFHGVPYCCSGVGSYNDMYCADLPWELPEMTSEDEHYCNSESPMGNRAPKMVCLSSLGSL